MKRSSFIKSLSALPLGIFAGNELVKSVGELNDTSKLTKEKLINNISVNTTLNKSIERPDLVDSLIKDVNGKINGVNVYKSKLPTGFIEYQEQGSGINVIQLNYEDVDLAWYGVDIKSSMYVVKTRKCKGGNIDPFKNNSQYIKVRVYEDIYSRIVNKKLKKENSLVMLYNIMLSLPIYHPETLQRTRGILYRSAIIQF